nr:hypothetical protein [Tanacetum cinerariifolium]
MVKRSKCWIENSKNNDIGAKRSEDLFWGKIMQDFNNGTYQGARTKNMIMGVEIKRLHDDVRVTNAQVIVNGYLVSSVASASAEGPIPPKTVEQKLAWKNELKSKSTLMLAFLDEHLLKFYACKNENEVISQEDVNLKLLRSLPSAWKNIALIIRNKYDLDTLSMDDLYNNLKVYESEIKIQSSSSINSQNVAFFSPDNSSSTNETVNTAHSVSATSFKDQASTGSYADDIDTDDLEEIDLKWQVAMLTMRVKRFIKMTRRKLDLNGKETVGFDRTKVECYNCHRISHFARECRAPRNPGNRNKDAPTKNAQMDTSTTNALVVQDGINGYDWSYQAEEELTNFVLMEYTSQGSSSSDSKGNITGPKEIRPVWDNTARVNHQNKLTHPHPKRNFVPGVVLTKSGQVPVNAAKQSSHRAATSVSAARRINTTASRPNVNNAIPTTYSYYKAHSPVTRPFNKKLAAKTNNFNEKVNTSKVNNVTTTRPKAVVSADQGIFDSGCSRHMTRNKSYLTDYQEIDGGFIALGGNAKGCKITGKGKIRTGKLDFEDVYYVKELKFNLFSVSQMYDKKYSVLFTDIECVVLSLDFKLLNESQILLKATLDESNLWYRRLGHINFKTINKLMRGNLVRGLPSKLFEDDHTCVACQKGKQQKPLDETPEILKNFIAGIENQMDHKVKTIRCDNGTEFKNRIMNEFCEIKGIRSEFSVARTPQQNGVAERKNRTLIEAARTMLADLKLPTTIWAVSSSEDKVADDAGKKSIEVIRKENGVHDPVKEDDKNDQEKDLRDQEETFRKQYKDANDNRMFTPVSVAGSTHVNLSGSIPINAATLSNVDLLNDPLMLDLEDTADL